MVDFPASYADVYGSVYRCFQNRGGFTPQIIHFNRVWNHYKSSILGAHPYFWVDTHIEIDKCPFSLTIWKHFNSPSRGHSSSRPNHHHHHHHQNDNDNNNNNNDAKLNFQAPRKRSRTKPILQGSVLSWAKSHWCHPSPPVVACRCSQFDPYNLRILYGLQGCKQEITAECTLSFYYFDFGITGTK